MVDPITVSYVLSMLVLVLGVGIWYRLYTDDAVDEERGQFRWLLIIPGFAAVSYAIMAAGLLTVELNGVDVYVFRYVDWIVTTPILVGYVGYVAGAPRKWVIGTGLADAGMIALGGIAVVLTGVPKWVAFAFSAGFHLTLLYALYAVFPRYVSERPERRRLFKILQNHVGLLWIAYPVVWLVSPVGIDGMSVVGTAMIIAYLDAVAKTPYVYFVYRERACFAESASVARERKQRTDSAAGTAAD